MHIIRWEIGILFIAVITLASGAEIDTNKLPAVASVQVDFSRDIRPIFEQSCFRCHGPEKPKSHFRLTSREEALKGGDNNPDDIVPGDSGGSRLIYSVSGLVEDMQMPPPDKGEPLTPAQISLLRAWIDQGAACATNQFPQTAFSFSPTLRWIGVNGSKSQFRAIEGIKEGVGGGVENFSMERQDASDKKVSMEGHFLFPEQDIQLKLQWTKTDAGFVHVGFGEWRKYYVDTGGFYPPTNSPSLNRGLYLDNGRAWIDLGLTRPNLPQTVLGYEYQFKHGDEATLQWGAVDIGANKYNIAPASKHIDEHTHIIKLDSSCELQGWRLEDNVRVEFYHLDTTRTNGWPYVPVVSQTPPGTIAGVAERDTHTQGANTFSVSKQLRDWWSVSSGYFYSRLDGDASVNQSTLNSSVAADQFSANGITLSRDSQVVSLGSLMGPWEGLTFSAGVQGEWTHQESSGLQNLTVGFPGDTSPTNIESGKFDSASARENLVLRYTKIPWTVVFAETRLRQESLHRWEDGAMDSPTLGSGPFTLDSDADIHSEEYRGGFNASPWRQLSFGGSFKHADNHTGYSGANSVVGAYPGFLQSLDTDENQVEARLVYRATSWLKTSFSFRWQKTDFNNSVFPISGLNVTNTAIESGSREAHVYSVNSVLTPFRRLYLSSTFSYSDSRIATASDSAINGVVPWDGNVYTVMSSANFALNQKTDLHATYVFSKSDYAQNNASAGLPAGINYERHALQVGVTRRFPKNIVTTLAYAFYQYHEPTSSSANDYTAQGIFATVTVPWPWTTATTMNSLPRMGTSQRDQASY